MGPNADHAGAGREGARAPRRREPREFSREDRACRRFSGSPSIRHGQSFAPQSVLEQIPGDRADLDLVRAGVDLQYLGISGKLFDDVL